MKTWTVRETCCRSVLLLLLLAVCLVGVVSQASSAAQLSWSPLYVDFGSVPIGTTVYQTLTLTNEDAGEVIAVSSIEFTFNQAGAFGWSASIPTEILPGESLEVDLSFTPSDFSFAMADMWIYNSSDNAPSLYMQLIGDGLNEGDPCAPLANCGGVCADLLTDVENCGTCYNVCPPVANGTVGCDNGECAFTCDEGYEPVGEGCEPEGGGPTALEMLQALIAYADESVANGTLIGFGLGDSVANAEARLDAFLRFLSRAEERFLEGKPDEACGQLDGAQRRTDGGYLFIPPPDFVAGEATHAIFDMIIEVMEAIAAEYPDAYCVPRIVER